MSLEFLANCHLGITKKKIIVTISFRKIKYDRKIRENEKKKKNEITNNNFIERKDIIQDGTMEDKRIR